jgi:hypothetical protein
MGISAVCSEMFVVILTCTIGFGTSALSFSLPLAPLASLLIVSSPLVSGISVDDPPSWNSEVPVGTSGMVNEEEMVAVEGVGELLSDDVLTTVVSSILV